MFPLPGALLLPRADLPLNIFEPRYLAMVDDALSGDRLIGMIQPADEAADLAGQAAVALRRIGCAGRITAYAETPDDRLLITLTGICRFRILEEIATDTALSHDRARLCALCRRSRSPVSVQERGRSRRPCSRSSATISTPMT